MSKIYDDSRYGVEKILTFPGHSDLIAAIGTVSQINFSEDIILTEFGVVISEVITAGGTLPVMSLMEGATELGSISIASASAVGTLVTTVTLTTTSISRGDTIMLYRKTSCATTGECDGYIKYRERFVSA